MEPDLVPLQGVQWTALDHRAVRARLERWGWSKCGEGDWAYAFRSPSGSLVARVSPFEPAYGFFAELCRRCDGNRYLPRMELASPLEGGGHLAVLEYLQAAADYSEADKFRQRWADPDEPDAELRILRLEVRAVDEWARQHVPWWGGVEMRGAHVLLSKDGQPKLIDLFFVRGEKMLADLLEDPNTFKRGMPLERRKYILDIPDLQHDHPADHLRRIRAALDEGPSGP